MKDSNAIRLDLRNLSKEFRQVIKKKKEEANDLLSADLRVLFSQPAIGKEDFKNLFRKHSNSIFASGIVDVDCIKFKRDNTPDLRSVPKSVRAVIKCFLDESERGKITEFAKIVSNIETISQEDLIKIRSLSKANPFQEKWVVA